VAGAVRDSDIYVAYGEIDAARNALSKALAEHPGDMLLRSRLAVLDGVDGAAAAHDDQPRLAADDSINFELEPLDSKDASNVVPFKRAV
jgi:hypothetical protein